MSLAKFADWLWGVVKSAIVLIHNTLIRIINSFIDGMSVFAHAALDLLPDYTAPTPGQLIDSIGFINALNWVIPIGFVIDCLTMLIFGILTYNLVAPALRWVKAFK